MTIYGYRCPVCDQTYTSSERCDRLAEPCRTCTHDGPLHRDYRGLAIHRPMLEHMNATLGKPISDMKQFNRELSRKSDELSAYTGVDQKLELLDPEQAKAGVTMEGLDSTNRERVKRGLKAIEL